MVVNVDKSRSQDEACCVNHFIGGSRFDVAYLRDHAVYDPNITSKRRPAGAVDDRGIPDQDRARLRDANGSEGMKKNKK
jgi:hypothetical protein